MSPPERPRIFISYAHRDGGELAERLQADLQSLGFDVWLDRLRLKGGDRWTNEIEDALDRTQVVLALPRPTHNLAQECITTHEKNRPNPKNGGEREAKQGTTPATNHQPRRAMLAQPRRAMLAQPRVLKSDESRK